MGTREGPELPALLAGEAPAYTCARYGAWTPETSPPPLHTYVPAACLQGIALMLLVMRTLRLSSLRVACILLPLCFFYDVGAAGPHARGLLGGCWAVVLVCDDRGGGGPEEGQAYTL